MKIIMKHIGLVLAGLFAAIIVLAQEIQVLPSDPAVSSGVLPNGMAFYVAVNPSVKGMADFALVQRIGAETSDSLGRKDAVRRAQENLGPQQHLLAPSVQEYFMSHGVIPGRNGFAQVTGNATVFRFEDMLLSGEASLDSTLFVLMGVARHSAQTGLSCVGNLYSPSAQAIVVAGDVDAAKVTEKLRMLSMMIPASQVAVMKEYLWKESDSAVVNVMREEDSPIACVSAGWDLQRTPREFMNTVQPVIYGRYMTELGIGAAERIKSRLKSEGVPCAEVSYDYKDSMESLDDESFRVSVSVSSAHVRNAVAALASSLAGLDASGVREDELRRAGLIYLDMMAEQADRDSDNSEYIDRCISAFIYNSPLTSRKDMAAFHSSRELDGTLERDLFNSIASASIDRERNLTLECRMGGDTVSGTDLKAVFDSVWTESAGGHLSSSRRSMPVPALQGPAPKVKIKSSKKEPLSGGTLWTLANGFKVVFKNMPSGGVVHYSLALNGGYGNIPDLQAGEGAHMSDILEFCTIGGTDYGRFTDVIRRHGMTMSLNAGLSVTTLEGRIPDDGFDYLMRVLLTVMNDRKPDKAAFDYYRGSESLRMASVKGRREARIMAVDSIMRPGYRYSSLKTADTLADGFLLKADALMSSLAEKVNDGMLVLVGDIDEKLLKEAVLAYAGGFRTEEKVFSRPVVNYQPVSGTSLYTLDGDVNSVDIVMSVPMALTADNYYTAALAAIALRDELAESVAGSGMWLRLRHNCRKYPQERFNLIVSLDEASVEGFIPGTVHEEPMEALYAVRSVLSDSGMLEITDSEMTAYREMLKKHVNDSKKKPEYWLHAISMRYLDGKDFVTGSDARINAVTADRVRELLASLKNGSRVEYIINRRKCATGQ